MRVLVVHHYPAYGGPYNELIEMQNHMLLAGVETIAVIPDEEGTGILRLDGRVPVRRLRLHRAHLSWNPLTNLRSLGGLPGDISRLRRLIRGLKPDIVKVYGPQNPQAAVAARMERVPLVWVVSSTRVPPLFRPLGSVLLRTLADAIMTNGRALIHAYPGLDTCPARVFPYYPPVDTARFRPMRAVERIKARQRFGLDPDGFVIGTVANINPQKGIETFLRAAALLVREFKDAQFVVVGGVAATQQDYFKHLTEVANDLGLSPDRLIFAGERSDVETALNTFDVKLITSIPMSEGTTTTGIEAMACGVPVVATDVGAVSEIIEDGLTGFVVPPLDPRTIAERCQRLLWSPDLRRRMGEAGRRKAVNSFDSASCSCAHLEAYQYAIKAAAIRPGDASPPPVRPIQ